MERLCILREEEAERGGERGVLGTAVGGEGLHVTLTVPHQQLELPFVVCVVAEEYLEHVESLSHEFMVYGAAPLFTGLCAVGEGRLGQFKTGEGCGYGGDGQRGTCAVGVVDGFDVLVAHLRRLLPSVDGVGTFVKSENVSHSG